VKRVGLIVLFWSSFVWAGSGPKLGDMLVIASLNVVDKGPRVRSIRSRRPKIVLHCSLNGWHAKQRRVAPSGGTLLPKVRCRGCFAADLRRLRSRDLPALRHTA
jgi:hypothetical protein